jgi:hypothetical protein
MATAIGHSPMNLPSSQLSINITEQVYKSQLLTNLNTNNIFPILRHDVTNKNDNINELFKIYHQNIWGLKGKTNEITLSLLTEAPHLICLTEHHLKNYEIDATPISKHKLGAKYCREKLKNGGVCIASLSKFNKGAYISGIKAFNHLPECIKALTNDQKSFKSALKRFLSSFFLLNE